MANDVAAVAAVAAVADVAVVATAVVAAVVVAAVTAVKATGMFQYSCTRKEIDYCFAAFPRQYIKNHSHF